LPPFSIICYIYIQDQAVLTTKRSQSLGIDL
jgi:hypothetical protein